MPRAVLACCTCCLGLAAGGRAAHSRGGGVDSAAVRAPAAYYPKYAGGTCTLPTNHTHEVAEMERLLAAHKWWNKRQLDRLEHVKSLIRGRGPANPPLIAKGNNAFDREAMGWWDASRRAGMLEPLAADILRSGVPGDFLEAGVFRGATSLFMAEMLSVARELGNGHTKRRMYVADAFGEGMPPPNLVEAMLQKKRLDSRSIDTQKKGWWVGSFKDPGVLDLQSVATSIARHHFEGQPLAAGEDPRTALRKEGVHFIKGFFNDTLPGPVKRLSLLRADSDIFSSTYETLVRLYPLVSDGGYVVFDDWKIIQSQQAILLFRQEQNITSPIFSSRREFAPPMQTIDCMAFWRKDAVTG